MATKKTPSQHETEKLKRLLADVEAKADSISQKFTEQWGNIRKEIATGLANQNEYLRKYNDVLSATEKRAFLEAEMADKQKEKIKETNEEIAQQEAIVKQQQAQLDTWVKGNADMSAAQEEQIKKARAILLLEIARLEALGKNVTTLKLAAKESEKTSAAADKILQKTKSLTFMGENWAQSLLGVGKRAEEIGEALGEKGVGGAVKLISAGMLKSITSTSLAGAAFEKMFELVKAGLQKLKAFATENFGLTAVWQTEYEALDEFQIRARETAQTSTTAFAAYKDTITSVAASTIYTQQQATAAYAPLFKASETFRASTEAQKQASIGLAKNLEMTMGVSLAQTAKTVQELTLTFGRTIPEAQKFTAQFALTARTLKMDVNKAFADLGAHANDLARFGLPDLGNQFYRLAKVQEQTSVSMGKIISTMDRFTTFEGALGAASKLNAVFGSTIDGMELMHVTMEEGPLKGFVKLREQMVASGMQIDHMNYAQFRVLQQELGLTAQELKQLGNVSVEELAKIANEEPFMAMSDAARKASGDAENMLTPTEKLTKATDTLAQSMSSVVGWFRDAKAWVADFVIRMGPLGKILTSIFVSTGPILVGLGLMIFKFKAFRFLFGGFAAAMAPAAVNVAKLGTSVTTTGTSVSVMGTKMQGAGLGIYSMGSKAVVSSGQIKILGNETQIANQKATGFMGKLGGLGKMMGGMGIGIAGLAATMGGSMMREQGGTGWNIAGTTMEYAGYGAMVGGAPGAAIGAIGGLAKSSIEAITDNDWYMNDSAGMYDVNTGARLSSGLNFASKPHSALMGEGPNDEAIVNRGKRALGAGNGVTPIVGQSSNASEMYLTVNLQAQDGKTYSSHNINKTLTPEEGTIRTAVNAALDEKLNLIYG